jgi:hypothetical protein
VTLLGEILETVLQLLIEGGAELIHRRYRTLGCLVTIGGIALVVVLVIWVA